MLVASCTQRRKEKGKESTNHRASNHCGGRRKVPTMSQVLSPIQYIRIRKTSGSNTGGATLGSCPGNHLPRYTRAHTVHIKAPSYLDIEFVKKNIALKTA